ncbi:MAG: PHP domain-containing protein [Candidatus Magasanikbacteria bacterium]|nr:PHP domain-containing protein [Candidatus Magasanikbacteria bacterium]
MKIDLHTHSLMSGHAYSTISEMAQAAALKGLEVLAITDHGPACVGAPSHKYFRNAQRKPKLINGVRILSGVELNIINGEGGLDLPDEVLEKLDVVIAGLHSGCGFNDLGIEKNTEAVIKAMQNPYVKILSHPYAKYFELDLEKIVQASIENDVMIELNASYIYTDRSKSETIYNNMIKTMKLLKAAGRKVVLTSDAHNHEEVGNFDEALARLAELGLEREDILNSDVGAVLDFLGVGR